MSKSLTDTCDEIIKLGRLATPRPWEVDDASMEICAQRGIGGCIADVCECPDPERDGKSNRDLLCLAANAAPDMAARLRRLGELLAQRLRGQISQPGPKCGYYDRGDFQCVISHDDARELLALLTGEEGEWK
jgi:hypothetical protein